MKLWVSSLLVLSMLAGPAWAYRDKKVEDAAAKAEELLAKGKAEDEAKAVAIVQKAAQGVKTGEAYVALGRIQEKASASIDDPAASFEKARELGAGDAEVLTAVALFELQAASAKRALETAKAAVAAPGAGPEAKAALALALAASNDAPAGLKTAEEALAAAPNSALAHEAKGQALFLTGHTAAAIASLKKAEELDPKSVNALVKLSVVLSAEGKNAEAEAAAKKALTINKNSAAALAAKAVAVVGVDVKRWNEAISDVQQGAFLNARSAFVHLSVGKVFEAAGNYDQASQSYTKALEADPGFVTARIALIGVLNLRGDTKNALDQAQKLVKEMPGSGDAHFLLAKAFIQAKDYKNAEPELEMAAKLLPGNAEAHAYFAALNFANGKDQIALESYKKALALKPDANQWRMDYALLLARSERAEEGLAELKRVVDSPNYNDPVGHVNMGYIYRNMKPAKTTEAAAAYQKALSLKPKDDLAAQANLGLAWSYLTAKEYDKAIAPYEQVIKLDSRLSSEAYNGMGWCYLLKRDIPQAEVMVGKAKDAGRPDSNLAESIQKSKEAQAKGEEAWKRQQEYIEKQRQLASQMENIDSDVKSPKPANRLRAIRTLAQLANGGGADTITYMLSTDADYGVREAAAVALGNIGRPAANKAIPYLKSNLTMNCQSPMIGTDSTAIAQEIACEDLRKTSRQVLQKLGAL